jgi:hypothetical protein
VLGVGFRRTPTAGAVRHDDGVRSEGRVGHWTCAARDRSPYFEPTGQQPIAVEGQSAGREVRFRRFRASAEPYCGASAVGIGDVEWVRRVLHEALVEMGVQVQCPSDCFRISSRFRCLVDADGLHELQELVLPDRLGLLDVMGLTVRLGVLGDVFVDGLFGPRRSCGQSQREKGCEGGEGCGHGLYPSVEIWRSSQARAAAASEETTIRPGRTTC